MIRRDQVRALGLEEADDLLTRAEASALLIELGLPMRPATLARLWSTGGDGPPCRHVRSRPYYPRQCLLEWARRQVGDLKAAAPAAAQPRRAIKGDR